MPLTSAIPSAGVYKRTSDYAANGRWIDANRVRFIDGRPAKIGGWTAIVPSSGAISGIPRGAFGWRNMAQNARFASFGTKNGLYVYNGDRILTITPVGYTTGRDSGQIAAGYGTGKYGAGKYGTPRTGGSSYTIQPTVWSFDTFGDLLISCANTDGRLYEWDGATATAATITNAPTGCQGVLVTDERHVVALGAGGNPRKVQWSDKGVRTTWTPAVGNKAGSFDLVDGSRILCGRRLKGRVGVWTEDAMHSMIWQPGPYVYGFEREGDNCGALSPQSVVVVAGTPYWMGRNKFFTFTGGIQEVPCDVLEHVFEDINFLQRYKVVAAYNHLFHEIWWWYPSAASEEPDKYVILNLKDGSWSVGILGRTAWVPYGVFDYPIASDSLGALFFHENGTDDNGEDMGEYIESAPFDLAEGDRILRLKSLVPDFKMSGGSVNLYIKTRFHPNGVETVSDPLQVQPTTERIFLRQAGRQLALKIEGAGTGHSWRLGKPRFDIELGGRR
jgi:hypothetical protein